MTARHASQRRRSPSAVGAASLLVATFTPFVVTAACRVDDYSHKSAQPTPPVTTVKPTSAPPSTPARATEIATKPPARKPGLTPRAAVDGAVRRLSAKLPAGGVSVAALNTRTGARYAHGSVGGMRT